MSVLREPSSSAERWPTVPVVGVPVWHAFGVVGSMGAATVGVLASISTHEVTRPALMFYAVVIVVLAALWAVVRRLRTRWALLVWPLTVPVGLAAASTVAPAAATLSTATIVVGFLYAGLTQPPGTSVPLLPVSVIAYLYIYSALPSSQLLVKLAVVGVVWVAAAELPAWLNGKLRTARADLARLAATDPLTGLANRRYWDDELTALLEHGQDPAVLLVDLDHFKRFNDENGHLAGDEMLIAFAQVIAQSTAAGDIASRWGGEEFAVAVHDRRRAEDVAERIRRHVPLGQTCSIGLVIHRPDERLRDLMRRADEALYQAKAEGRDRIVAA